MWKQALLVVISVLAVANAQAMPPQERDIFYYSDSSYSNLIGWIAVTCYGIARYGSTSAYSQVFDGDRCGGSPLDADRVANTSDSNRDAVDELVEVCTSLAGDRNEDGVVSPREAFTCVKGDMQ